MKAEQFVAQLADASPTREELSSAGLDDEEVDQIMACFVCDRRSGVGEASFSSELERLVTLYDCSRAMIGELGFARRAEPAAHGLSVAHWEADPIVVRSDGVVVVIDHAANTPLLECAVNGERFLDALALAAPRGKTTCERDSREWADAVAKCVESSGLAGSSRFWASLVPQNRLPLLSGLCRARTDMGVADYRPFVLLDPCPGGNRSR